MYKKEFEKYILENSGSVKAIYCRIWSSVDEDKDIYWLDVFIDGAGYTTVYTSEYSYDLDSVVRIQNRWYAKLVKWLCRFEDVTLVRDRCSV